MQALTLKVLIKEGAEIMTRWMSYSKMRFVIHWQPALFTCTTCLITLLTQDRHSHLANAAACMTVSVMQGAMTHCDPQLEELEHRLKEVAVDLNQRIRQELVFPAVVHFYSWLLQGVTSSLSAHYT